MTDDSDKQESPSAYKIRKAREEGNVAKSPDVVAFVGITIGILAIFALFPLWLNNFEGIYIICMNFLKIDFTFSHLFSLFLTLLMRIVIMLLPIFAALVLTGIIANVAQFGFLMVPKVLKPNLSKINPLRGFRNLFSLKKVLDGLMITLKVLIAFILGGGLILLFLKQISQIATLHIFSQMLWVRDKILVLTLSLLVFFCIMAIGDFLIKRYQYTKSLRMSKQEVKDEYKQQEGNPEVRAKIRQIMLKNTMGKMMQAIPTANVVITNPTHYAIALRFNETDPAPVVVAKGVDHLAIRIKGIAREHEIQIIENPELARTLYKQVDLEEPIPRSLFEAVAIVFAQVKAIQDRHINT